MTYTNITERLKRVAAIVDSWQRSNAIPQIERDIALGELREVYNELLVLDGDSASVKEDAELNVADVEEDSADVEEDSVAEEQPTEESERDPFYDALDIDALLGLSDEPREEQLEAETKEVVAEVTEEIVPEQVAEPEVAVEPTPEPAPEPEVAVESTPEPEHKVDVAKSLSGGLFDLNDIPVRSKSKRKMISLYSDNPITQVAETKTETPKVVEKPVETHKAEVAQVEAQPSEPVQRLGDSFAGVTTLADKMAADDAPTTPFNRIKELRAAIGLNDKFLMIRDLFGGDAERYEATIDTLDEFDDLDECIIYIVENFRWNPDLEASKLLISLIERKLA
ncbi:MAG: hypothetical protein J6Q28_04740 [Alistipes sp.]|nr:hypothetical protein [Alistipes sp.]